MEGLENNMATGEVKTLNCQSPGNHYNTKVTASVVITCIVAASGGLIFGYNIGISGGVTPMVPFLQKFFPSILSRKAAENKTDMFCTFNSQILTSVTSSLYLAGLVASFFAARITSSVGRRNVMVLGGFISLAGGVINGGAVNVAMVILGRILLGFGVGFTNQAAPGYLSEMAPPKWRGAFNNGFEFFIGVGVIVANCINYDVAKLSYGWRISLGLAIVPAIIMSFGGLLITDTPTSLVERGKVEQAKKALSNARGAVANVEEELADLVKVIEVAKAETEQNFVTIFERQYRPHLTMAILISFFQQLTGVSVIAFYAPVLFQSVGFGSNAALIATIILGVVNLVSIVVSSSVVDRFGRRFLFKVGGASMFACQVILAVLIATMGGTKGTKHEHTVYAVIILVLMCHFAVGFGLSWGPLVWLIPSEIFPMRIRAMGQCISVAVNLGTTFALSQTFLTMLCYFKYGVFLFYAGWTAIMTLFVVMFLPETKGIHIDEMTQVWKKHWYWRRFVE